MSAEKHETKEQDAKKRQPLASKRGLYPLQQRKIVMLVKKPLTQNPSPIQCMIGSLIVLGTLLSVQVGAEPMVAGQVRLASGEPVAGAYVRLFDLRDLRSWVEAITDESGAFALPLGALPGAAVQPTQFSLGENYPNPFNPATVIPYHLQQPMSVRLEVFNVLGQHIATLVDGQQSSGSHMARWDGTDAAGAAVAAGVYLYRLSGEGVQATRSMVLIDGQAGVPAGASGGMPQAGAEATEAAWVYGLTVSGPGLMPFVDPAFRVAAGPVELVVEASAGMARAKTVLSGSCFSGGILGDVDNNGRVDFFDALLVALYSRGSSTVMPNNGDISLGDVNADGRIDFTDAYLIAGWLNDSADPTLPAGIGEGGGGVASPDCAALVALYEATGGDNWENNANWLSDAPLDEWYGVTTDDDGRVTHLELGGNDLSGVLPESLGNLTHLQALYLNDNQLSGSIPSSWENLSNLQEIALRNNPLSGCIPAGLREVSNRDFDALGLSYCGLSDTVPEKTELQHPKVGSALDELIARIEAGEISEEEAAQEAPLYRGKSMAVTIYLSGNVDGVVSFLEANGVSPRNVGEDYIEAFVPVLLLAETSEQPSVLWVEMIQPPQLPESFETSSTIPGNGPELHGSPAWNQAGYRGQGIKVGVIDGGFEDIRSLMGSELPQTIKARCYRTSSDEPTDDPRDCENGENHGTVVAETVMDIAPEVSLYIAVPKSKGDMRNVVDWMIAEGVSVINHSVGWSFDGPGDGTSPYGWSSLNTVDRAVERGIVWVNSAGNYAQQTWFKRGPSDTDGDGFLEFADGKEEITGSRGTHLQLRWTDKWGGATRDLDLYLYRNGQIIKESTNYQEGEPRDRPHEWISIGDDAEYKVKVVARGDNLPQWIQLVVWRSRLDQYTESGSINNPAESTNPGLLTVGAAHWRTPNTIESYSSRGPTPDGRVKPDLVGAACGETTLKPTFCGTSQASPHVAGMAALVRQRFPNYTPAQVAAYLKDNAEQRVLSPDPNNIWGHGFAVLPLLPEANPDRAVLVALYEATNGNNWTNNTNWLSDRPLGEWFGVTTDENGRVLFLNLGDNALSGELPASLGSLTNLLMLNLGDNALSVALPTSLANLPRLQALNLEDTQLCAPTDAAFQRWLDGIDTKQGVVNCSDPEPSSTAIVLSVNPQTIREDAGETEITVTATLDGQALSEDTTVRLSIGPSSTATRDADYSVSFRRLVIPADAIAGSTVLAVEPIDDAEVEDDETIVLMGAVDGLRGDEAAITIIDDDETPSTDPDRAVLVALYEATDGANWTNNTNWLSDEPLNEWYGVTTDGNGRVTHLELAENGLSGVLPSSLGNLTNLQGLRLHFNQLSGVLPSSLGNLTNLQSLALNSNAFSGELPSWLGNLTNLELLALHFNLFSGELPSWLGNLTNLEFLALGDNAFSGELPSSLGNLTNLELLALGDNAFSGELPSSLGNLTNLYSLTLRRNQFSGELPSSLVKLTNLNQLWLDNTQLCAPTDATFQRWLDGIDDKSGVVNCEDPEPINPDRAALVALYEATNGANWKDNTNWLSDKPLSQWHGVTTDANGRVIRLDLDSNQLSGALPPSLGNLTNLQDLWLFDNQLSGALPSSLGNLTNLRLLWLSSNAFSGSLPSWLGNLTNLVMLQLSDNQLSGALPPSLGNLTNLQDLRLGANQFSGVLPSSLGNLTNLQRLYLGANQFSGVLPSSLGNLTNLQQLGLADNQLSGALPPSLGNLTNLQDLWLSLNQFSGVLPSWLGNLTNLRGLTLNSNEFSGELPSSLRNLANLEVLGLTGTQLCAPTDAAFQAWLEGIEDKSGVVNCGPAGPQRLTNNGGQHPSWSPDGRYIAFLSASPLYAASSLYVMDSDGSNQRQLTNNVFNDPYGAPFAWSPDGRHIAFISGRDSDNRNYEIYVIDSDGSNQRQLTNNNVRDWYPSWSADSRRITFVSRLEGTDQIYVMDSDGSNLLQLTRHGSENRRASWSPDGRHIAFDSWDIQVVDPDGSNLRNLTNNISGWDGWPFWSPNSRHIAFISEDSDQNNDIWVMGSDGSNQQKLTQQTRHTGYVWYGRLAWAPDSRQIAFKTDRDGNHEIYVMGLDGSNLRRLTNNSASDESPSWSPDGRHIAFTSNRDGRNEIYVIDLP